MNTGDEVPIESSLRRERTKERLSAQLAVVSIATIASLLVVEFCVRIVGYDLNVDHNWKHHPSLGWTLDPNSETIDNVNQDGFRTTGPTEPKLPGIRRLLILGDSFTTGAAYRYTKTFAGRLEQWLANSGERWEVFSIGVGDWGTGQELLAYKEYGLPWQPDAVVLQVFPFNDLSNNSLAMAETCSLQDHHRPYLAPSPEGFEIKWVSTWRTRMRNTSVLFGLVENQLVWRSRAARGLNLYDPPTRNRYFRSNAKLIGLDYEGALASLLPAERQPPAVRSAWEVTEALLRRLQEELSSRGIAMIAVVIPYARTIPPFEADYLGARGDELDGAHATETVERVLRDLGVAVVSVRERIMAGSTPPDEFFRLPSDSHLSAQGHESVARWILEEMASQELSVPKTPMSGEQGDP